MKKKNNVSIIVPVFNEEENLVPLLQRLFEALEYDKNFEVLFVDDGSTDGTIEKLRLLSHQYSTVRYLSFSRNFGHQCALRAGLMHADGDCVISLDADLQHPPEVIPEMIARWREGFEIVLAVRSQDNSLPFLKRLTSRLYSRTINSLADIHLEECAADFRLLDRKVVSLLQSLPEGNLFLRGIVDWVGFKKSIIRYRQADRFSGTTKYSLRKMIRLAMQGITAFSVRPLRLATLLGLIIAGFASMYALYAVFIYVFTDRTVTGWTSLIVSVLFLGGMQMFLLGIIGEYLGRLFMESKRRPDYIIREKGPEPEEPSAQQLPAL
jgi:glycosyltransferase involved in cell wall biosynthesis